MNSTVRAMTMSSNGDAFAGTANWRCRVLRSGDGVFRSFGQWRLDIGKCGNTDHSSIHALTASSNGEALCRGQTVAESSARQTMALLGHGLILG